MKTVHISDEGLTKLPQLPPDLNKLFCFKNRLTELTPVSFLEKLYHLDCDQNLLTELPQLPKDLQRLECCYNQLTQLPHLPKGLTILRCDYNQLTELPPLPPSLEVLSCRKNPLNQFPQLPPKLNIIIISLCQIGLFLNGLNNFKTRIIIVN
jgi:hypothetical protein